MPLFFRKKKPSEDSKKRLEYQLCLSKEAGADDILDISACELTEVTPFPASHIPVSLFYQVFILHGNQLKSLVPKGCCISSLVTLKVLDLHENNLTSLPDDIGQLASLQVLNLEKNQIKSLPDSIGDLRHLQTLNVKGNCLNGNCLNGLPSSVGRLCSLRTLDLSETSVRELPQELALARTLESLTLDAAQMSYPPASVCNVGTEDIQRFLCNELGEEYCPPSQYLLPVLEGDSGKQSSDNVDGLEVAWQVGAGMEQRNHEKLVFERQLEEKQKEHHQLLLMNNSYKENILMSVKQEQERLELGVSVQQKLQEAERQRTLKKVRQAETGITSRISNLLMENKRQRKRAMQKMLSESCTMRLLQEASDSRRQNLVTETCRSLESQDRKFDQVLSLQQLDKSKAIAQILQEEEMQKAAFQALQLQKDSVHGYIREQIRLIEGELMQLTRLEVKRRDLDTENLQEVLLDQRSALSDLLQQLLKQKDQREVELRQVLAEMELKSDSNQQNYWMIQYQRLLDAKPLSLRMEEAGVERDLVNLLCTLSAQHYLPIMAHHRVTAQALRHMTPQDLSKVCVCSLSPSPTTGVCKPYAQEVAAVLSPSTQPSAPDQTPSPQLTPVTPSAPSPMEAPGSSECVVCMEMESQVIFLPCGHVCCCQVCSDALQSCPLCRSNITQHVRLYHG
uniref:RING-type domain-containing protein n=1 Tax=Esox lucius TaxID=8010 RepID=A0A6Q2YX38_ESOLU